MDAKAAVEESNLAKLLTFYILTILFNGQLVFVVIEPNKQMK